MGVDEDNVTNMGNDMNAPLLSLSGKLSQDFSPLPHQSTRSRRNTPPEWDAAPARVVVSIGGHRLRFFWSSHTLQAPPPPSSDTIVTAHARSSEKQGSILDQLTMKTSRCGAGWPRSSHAVLQRAADVAADGCCLLDGHMS